MKCCKKNEYLFIIRFEKNGKREYRETNDNEIACEWLFQLTSRKDIKNLRFERVKLITQIKL